MRKSDILHMQKQECIISNLAIKQCPCFHPVDIAIHLLTYSDISCLFNAMLNMIGNIEARFSRDEAQVVSKQLKGSAKCSSIDFVPIFTICFTCI